MTNNGKNSKRTLAKKVTSFVLYTDQVSQIQAIIESTGTDKAAQVFRDLLDEALSARRRKTAHQLVLPDEPSSNQLSETLETIQTLLLKLIQQGEKLIQQGEKARCVRGINLELLQEVLAAACAGRFGLWESLAVPALIEDGKSSHEIASLFESQTTKGKAVAYGLAKEIRDQLCAREANSPRATAKHEEDERLANSDNVSDGD